MILFILIGDIVFILGMRVLRKNISQEEIKDESV